jgi:transposase
LQAKGGLTAEALAPGAAVSPQTIRKWIARYEAEGVPGLSDCSSRPRNLRCRTPQYKVEAIIALQRQRLRGRQIA